MDWLVDSSIALRRCGAAGQPFAVATVVARRRAGLGAPRRSRHRLRRRADGGLRRRRLLARDHPHAGARGPADARPAGWSHPARRQSRSTEPSAEHVVVPDDLRVGGSRGRLRRTHRAAAHASWSPARRRWPRRWPGSRAPCDTTSSASSSRASGATSRPEAVAHGITRASTARRRSTTALRRGRPDCAAVVASQGHYDEPALEGDSEARRPAMSAWSRRASAATRSRRAERDRRAGARPIRNPAGLDLGGRTRPRSRCRSSPRSCSSAGGGALDAGARGRQPRRHRQAAGVPGASDGYGPGVPHGRGHRGRHAHGRGRTA